MKKQELQKALEIVKPGLSSREIIEQSTSFAFINGKVVTYNDEISISHPVEGLEIEGAIRAEELYQLLNKIKKDEIEVTIEKNEVVLKASRTRAGLTLQQEIKLPLEEIGEQSKWKELPKDFTKYIEFVVGACSRDMSISILTCVHVNKNGYIEASDGFHIAKYTLEEKIPVKTFLIPSTSALELIKLTPTKIAEGQGWMHFQTDGGTAMSCRVFEDNFPDTSNILVVEGKEIIFPKTINDILDRAAVFSKREHYLDETIEIRLENKRVKVKSKSDSGWFEEEANIRYDDDPVSFSITPYLLKDILLETQTCIFSENCLKFTGDNWEYVTMLKD